MNAEDMIEAAWGIIANVSDGNWTDQPQTWRDAAAKWRDQYHEWIGREVSEPTTAELLVVS